MHTTKTIITVERIDDYTQKCSIKVSSSDPQQDQELQDDLREKIFGATKGCQSALANIVFAIARTGGNVDKFLEDFIHDVKRQAESARLNFTITGKDADFSMN